MNLQIMHPRPERNEIPPLIGLPLFDWRPLPASPAGLLDRRAERVARLSGLPLNVVRLHLIAAGLGLEAS